MDDLLDQKYPKLTAIFLSVGYINIYLYYIKDYFYVSTFWKYGINFRLYNIWVFLANIIS
jgi:hypothetical protein